MPLSEDQIIDIAWEFGLNKCEKEQRDALFPFAAAIERAAIESIARQAPVAKLRVLMDTHDMGQSLAPNPPFKSHRIWATSEAEALPLGEYALYASPLPPPEGAQREALDVLRELVAAKAYFESHSGEPVSQLSARLNAAWDRARALLAADQSNQQEKKS